MSESNQTLPAEITPLQKRAITWNYRYAHKEHEIHLSGFRFEISLVGFCVLVFVLAMVLVSHIVVYCLSIGCIFFTICTFAKTVTDRWRLLKSAKVALITSTMELEQLIIEGGEISLALLTEQSGQLTPTNGGELEVVNHG